MYGIMTNVSILKLLQGDNSTFSVAESTLNKYGLFFENPNTNKTFSAFRK